MTSNVKQKQRLSKSFLLTGKSFSWTHVHFIKNAECARQPRTQASSCYPSYQRRLGADCGPRRIFPTSSTGDVTSKFAEDDWERGCVLGACGRMGEDRRGNISLTNLLYWILSEKLFMNAKGRVKEDGTFKFYKQQSSRRGRSYHARRTTHDVRRTTH